MTRPMVFGIGLEKTGTTSLHTALNMLGWKSLHDSKRMAAGTAQEVPLSSLVAAGFNAFCDNPIPRYFRELDEAYPGSKFVYTSRPVEDWIASRMRHNYRTIHWDFDRSRLRKHWEAHREMVQEHFRRRPSDLLSIDICNAEGWEKLCPFLGVDTPRESFPWANRSPRFRFVSYEFSNTIPEWQALVKEFAGKPRLHVVEAGSGDFRTGLWLVQNVCSHESSRLTCIDQWSDPETERRFDHNVEASRCSNKVRKLKGDISQILSTIPGASASLVHLGGLVGAAMSRPEPRRGVSPAHLAAQGSHGVAAVPADRFVSSSRMMVALLCFRILKRGGLMVCSDSGAYDTAAHGAGTDIEGIVGDLMQRQKNCSIAGFTKHQIAVRKFSNSAHAHRQMFPAVGRREERHDSSE